MKASLLLAVIVISVGYCSPVLACHIFCRAYYENCLTLADKTPAQCKILYNASLREDGLWGSPAARAASKTAGDEAHCRL